MRPNYIPLSSGELLVSSGHTTGHTSGQTAGYTGYGGCDTTCSDKMVSGGREEDDDVGVCVSGSKEELMCIAYINIYTQATALTTEGSESITSHTCFIEEYNKIYNNTYNNTTDISKLTTADERYTIKKTASIQLGIQFAISHIFGFRPHASEISAIDSGVVNMCNRTGLIYIDINSIIDIYNLPILFIQWCEKKDLFKNKLEIRRILKFSPSSTTESIRVGVEGKTGKTGVEYEYKQNMEYSECNEYTLPTLPVYIKQLLSPSLLYGTCLHALGSAVDAICDNLDLFEVGYITLNFPLIFRLNFVLISSYFVLYCFMCCYRRSWHYITDNVSLTK